MNPALFLGDILGLNASFLLAYIIIYHNLSGLLFQPYLQLFLYVNLSWVILVMIYRPYRFSRMIRVYEIIKSHLSLLIIHLLLLSAYLIININSAILYSRLHLLLTYLLFAAFIFFWKFGFNLYLKVYRSKGGNNRNVIIIGYGDIAENLKSFFTDHKEYGIQMIGYLDNQADNDKVLGKIDEIQAIFKNNEVDQVYICLPYIDHENVKFLIKSCEEASVKVKLITDFRGFSSNGLELERFEHIPVINVTGVPLDITKNTVFKRTFDITFSLIIFIFIFSWLFPIVALLIKLDSKGPVFFRQLRTGKDDKDFLCWKFRTMQLNDEADIKQAIKNDPRITMVGSFLRKTSLDELPQFINVLLGDMSIVGPRPHPINLNTQFSSQIENFKQRHSVKPGITGLAQAKGYRGETKSIFQMAGRVRLDKFYIDNWTMLLDFKILILTVLSMVKGDENAY